LRPDGLNKGEERGSSDANGGLRPVRSSVWTVEESVIRAA
jgi:hypothetical protein